MTAVIASVSHITEEIFSIEVTATDDRSDRCRRIILWKASLNERCGCFPYINIVTSYNENFG